MRAAEKCQGCRYVLGMERPSNWVPKGVMVIWGEREESDPDTVELFKKMIEADEHCQWEFLAWKRTADFIRHKHPGVMVVRNEREED